MMDVTGVDIKIQKTPNPNAKKFVLNHAVKETGKVSYTNAEDCKHVPLAWELLNIEGVRQVHFYENVLTITKDAAADWEHIQAQTKNVIHLLLPLHDADFKEKGEASRDNFTVEMLMIDSILDRTVRPYLQGDGGDIEVLAYHNNILTVRYQGACGGCPSAQAGTLESIIGVLRSEFNDEIEVVTV